MNKNYTLKELADMFAYERRKALHNGQSIEGARMLALKHVFDAVGYKFPADIEREAFEAWYQVAQIPQGETQAFAAWKAGREELRKAVPMLSFDKNITITSEPDWIPWNGDDKSPIVGQQRYEVKYRDGQMHIYTQNSALCWRHSGTCADILAYRIL